MRVDTRGRSAANMGERQRMSPTTNQATERLIRNYYACFNERRLAEAASLFAADAVMEAPPFTAASDGRRSYERFTRVWLAAFPDACLDVESVASRNDTLHEVNLVATGTHMNLLDLGAYGRFKPTGERTTLRLRELIEVHDGQITYSNVSLDVHDLTRQLSSIDYDALACHLDRLQRLRAQLADAGDDTERRRSLADRIGRELDAARLAVRPWFRS
jgi:predicted ester cyclase